MFVSVIVVVQTIIVYLANSFLIGNFFFTKQKGEDSDMDDFEIKKTDNVLICGHFDEDVCSLNLYCKKILMLLLWFRL